MIIIIGCASVQSPEGGPKDTSPPILLSSNPTNKTTIFSGKSIILALSEDVSEDNIKTPFLSPKTTTQSISGSKKLKIIPDFGFKPNTTYVLTLCKKIKDDKEGNKLRDTSLIFSTGPNIDTLQGVFNFENIYGKEVNEKCILIMKEKTDNEYIANNDSLKPIKIYGLHKGKYEYQIFQDKNENYVYEEEDGNLLIDSVSFDSSFNLKGRMLPQKYKKQKTLKQMKGDTLTVESSVAIWPEKSFFSNLISSNKEKTLFWIYPFRKDLTYSFMDSIGNKFIDTLQIDSIEKNRSLNQIPINFNHKVEKIGAKIKIHYLSNWKVNQYPSSMEINLDSTWKKTSFLKETFGFSFELDILKPIMVKWKVDTITYYNQTGKSRDSINISKSDFENTGIISGEVIGKDKENLIIELINQQKERISSTKNSNFTFKVKPGIYKIQVFKDLNKDENYTGGNKMAQRKAEPLYVYPEVIELKPGWDLENIEIDPRF
jgi:uncharacterized protein (DUF2141 family)